MEFKEFSNPESQDYDIKSSFGGYEANSVTSNPYIEQLIDLIGVLEDVTEEELQQNYGISIKGYFNPTAETVSKVKDALGIRKGR